MKRHLLFIFRAPICPWDAIDALGVSGWSTNHATALEGFVEHFVVEGIQAKRRLFGSLVRVVGPSILSHLRLYGSIRARNSSQFLLTNCSDPAHLSLKGSLPILLLKTL